MKTSGSFKKGHRVNLGKKGSLSGNWKGGISDNKKEYIKKYNETYHHKRKEYSRNLRRAVVEALGGKCVHCGFSDSRALQIDHINGGGSKERKERNYKGSYHKHVIESFLKQENKYQLLCANCNWIKREENNERNNQ